MKESRLNEVKTDRNDREVSPAWLDKFESWNQALRQVVRHGKCKS